ncbi:MAG: hypothetical protein WCF25_04210 [Acidimicrobiales bacterium]
MHAQKSIGSRRHVVTRFLVTTALLGSTFLVGLATTASAVGTDHIVVTQQPSTTDASGAVLAQQPIVELFNASNALDTSAEGNVTVSITSGAPSTLTGTATVAANNGIATFTGLALNALVGPYTLTFADSTDSPTTTASNTITVSVGAATQLKFATAPSAGAVSGVALTPQPVVDIDDSGGNIVTSDTSTVTAAFTGAGSTVTGNTKAAVAGVATFSGLTITAPIDTTTGVLNFTDGSLLPNPLTSVTISVTGPASKLAITTQPSLTDANGVALAVQPVVAVEDASGAVVKGDTSTVTAALVGGNVGSSITNNTKAAVAGVATFVGAAINAAPGSYNITFTDGSLTPATTTAQTAVTTGAAAKLTIVTQPSATAAAGAPLSPQPVIDITDTGGNLIASNTSTVTATLTSGSGTVTHNTAVAVGGVANFSGLTLNVPAANYTLTFTDGTLTDAISTSIQVSAGAASQLAIVTEPSATAASGAALAVQPIIKVEDAGGNAVVGNTSTVTATVTSAAGTVTNGTATVSSTTGLATFAGLALNELVGPYTLTFSDGTFTSAVSTPIVVSAGVATQLVITTQPSATVASGAPLAQQPVVKVEDAAGNVVTTDASTITTKITTGGVSVTPSTKVVVAGVASFSGLTVNALDGAYTLTFSDGALTPATSASIAVTTGTASKLVIATEPSTSTASGVVLRQQPVIKVEDTGGNVVTSVSTGAATAAITTGAGGTLSAGASANFVAGVATFSGLTLTGTPGTLYTLTYSGDSLIVVDTAQIDVGQPQAALVVATVHATYGRNFALKTTGGSGTGALSFTVANGTATGCTLTGTTLKSTTAGTCIVTATKANDATYAAISSAATTVTFAKLAIPGAVRIKFVTNSAALPGAGRTAIVILIRKLTVHSVVSITGYAKGNTTLAHRRALIAQTYLVQRLHVRVQLHWSSASSATQGVVISTKSQ